MKEPAGTLRISIGASGGRGPKGPWRLVPVRVPAGGRKKTGQFRAVLVAAGGRRDLAVSRRCGLGPGARDSCGWDAVRVGTGAHRVLAGGRWCGLGTGALSPEVGCGAG